MRNITEEGFAYLRNINTRPGPGAGQSIDKRKPGPDADRLRNEQPQGGDGPYFITGGDGQTYEARYDLPLPSESPAPSPGPQDVRVTDAVVEAAWAAYVEATIRMSSDKAMRFAITAALAQSNAQPPPPQVHKYAQAAMDRMDQSDVELDDCPELLSSRDRDIYTAAFTKGFNEALEGPAQSDAQPSIEPVTFWYQNYRGEISRRVAAVLGLRWGTSEYHKEPQWLLRAFDLEKEVEREFAVKDMAPTYDALRQSDAEPVGWQLVPKEPTVEMLKNVASGEDEEDALYIWHGMLAVAPAAPPRPDASDAQPVGWFCQPTDSGKPTPRKWLLRFDDADCGDCYFDDEKEAYAAFERANIAYSCYLFATVPTRTGEAPWVSTTPPRPDASGLVEAAEWQKRCESAEAALRHALQHYSSNLAHPIEQEARDHFNRFRTRAADRREK